MGGLDPNIILSYRPPQIAVTNPIDTYGKVLSLRAMMQEGSLRAQQLQGAQLAYQMQQLQFQHEKNLADLFKNYPDGGGTAGAVPSPVTPPAAVPAAGGSPDAGGIAGPPPGAFWMPQNQPPATAATGAGPVAPAAAGAVGMPGQVGPSLGAMVRAGGTQGLTAFESLQKAQKGQIDLHIAQLDDAAKNATALARKINGIDSNDSWQAGLSDAYHKGQISVDDWRQQSQLQWDDPAAQAFMKRKSQESLTYAESLTQARDNAKAQRDQQEFASTQQQRDKEQFASDLQTLTNSNQISALLAKQSPFIRQLYGGYSNTSDLNGLKNVAGLAAGKGVGTVVPYPGTVQQQKVEEAGAQGYAGAVAKITAENQQWQPVANTVKASPDPAKAFANLPEEYKTHVGPLLAGQGFTEFKSKPTDTELNKLQTLSRGIQSLSDLKAEITKPDHYFETGPVFGHVKELPGSVAGKTLDAQMQMVRSVVGDLIKGGTLRTSDVSIYEKMFPNTTDPQDVIKNKLDMLMNQIQGEHASYRNELENAGRALPKDSTPAPPAAAAPAEKAPTPAGTPRYKTGDNVMRNGKTWTYIGPMNGDDWRDQKNWLEFHTTK